MKNRNTWHVICSRCGKVISDEAELDFDFENDSVPICKKHKGKPNDTSFVDANQRQLKKWDEGYYD